MFYIENDSAKSFLCFNFMVLVAEKTGDKNHLMLGVTSVCEVLKEKWEALNE